jgi:hypothetical protein
LRRAREQKRCVGFTSKADV